MRSDDQAHELRASVVQKIAKKEWDAITEDELSLLEEDAASGSTSILGAAHADSAKQLLEKCHVACVRVRIAARGLENLGRFKNDAAPKEFAVETPEGSALLAPESVTIRAAQFIQANLLMPLVLAMAERGRAAKGEDTSKMEVVLAGSGKHVKLGSVQIPEAVSFEEAKKILDAYDERRKKMTPEEKVRNAGFRFPPGSL